MDYGWMDGWLAYHQGNRVSHTVDQGALLWSLAENMINLFLNSIPCPRHLTWEISIIVLSWTKDQFISPFGGTTQAALTIGGVGSWEDALTGWTKQHNSSCLQSFRGCHRPALLRWEEGSSSSMKVSLLFLSWLAYGMGWPWVDELGDGCESSCRTKPKG